MTWEKIENIHKGEEAYFFGKGPSLDRFIDKHKPDFDFPGIRFGINQNPHLIPNMNYSTWLDEVVRTYSNNKYDARLFFPLPVGLLFTTKEGVKYQGAEKCFLMEKRKHWKRPEIGSIGCDVATFIMLKMGIKKITYVGCDGESRPEKEYSKYFMNFCDAIGWKTPPSKGGGFFRSYYNGIKKKCENIEIVFWHNFN